MSSTRILESTILVQSLILLAQVANLQRALLRRMFRGASTP
jgi:hypothetical protein